jgi:hypothetical protein
MQDKPRFTQWPPKGDLLVRSIGKEPFIRLWRSDVGKMISATKSSGAHVILMTYPNYDSPPISEFLAMSRKYSVPLVDNHKSFEILINQGRGEEVFCSDFRHPNGDGYAIVASNAFDSIVRIGVLERKITKMKAAQQVNAADPNNRAAD